MRYLMQIVVMLSDVLIILAASILIYLAPLEPVIWIVIALAFNAWHNSGGFMAWKPSNIRMFMENAKGLGL